MRKRSPGGVAASRVGCKRNNGKETVEISLKKETAAAAGRRDAAAAGSTAGQLQGRR